MVKGLWCAGLMFLGLAWNEGVSQAKPPDLPVDLRVEFEEEETPGAISLDFDLFTGKISLNFALPGNFWQSWFRGPAVISPREGQHRSANQGRSVGPVIDDPFALTEEQ